VSKVTVFRPDGDTEMKEPTIVYYVENAPTTSQKDSNSAQKSEQTAGQRQAHNRRDLLQATDDLVSATDEGEDLWYKNMCRGRKLTESCMS
jgi:hypothetical protein